MTNSTDDISHNDSHNDSLKDSLKDITLDKRIAALPRQLELPRDLWPTIEQRIQAGGDSARLTRSLWAASAAAVLLAVAIFNGTESSLEAPATPQRNAAVASAMEQSFERQREALLQAVKANRALSDNWQQQIEELENARKAILGSLEQEPDNFYLIKILQNIHEQQISLIERVHQTSYHSI